MSIFDIARFGVFTVMWVFWMCNMFIYFRRRDMHGMLYSGLWALMLLIWLTR